MAQDTASHPRVLRELGATVIAIGDKPDGININDNVGSTHPANLQQAVLDHEAQVGIALDGDGDRIIMVNEKGELVDGDGILYILATQAEQQVDGVVGTLMTNMGLQLAFDKAGIAFERAKVGDRYVMQGLEKNGWVLGGESSGHILTLDKAQYGRCHCSRSTSACGDGAEQTIIIRADEGLYAATTKIGQCQIGAKTRSLHLPRIGKCV